MNKGSYSFYYPRPVVTTDYVVLCEDSDGLSVQLIERANESDQGGKTFLNEIHESVKTFTRYAAGHPELHFLVTPVGCGGGRGRPSKIAPMFRETSNSVGCDCTGFKASGSYAPEKFML